ncbi:amidase [Diaporthe amygdali]|uniref:amidase n=1 Tax=Phomopsis amygdali TaxID=1214568 RepID=UPI0022FE5B8D|nr:amidase [Diaporthe amygdali]KAJ0122531.1 amidase [Diaporthe amygdali]
MLRTQVTETVEFRFRGQVRLHIACLALQSIWLTITGDGKIKGALNSYSLDAIIVSSRGPANYFAACGGLPQITVPLDYQTASLDLEYNNAYGISDIGDVLSELILLRIGVVLENITRARDEADARRLV